MNNWRRQIEAFFFTPKLATGFGLVRIGWAAVLLYQMSVRMGDIVYMYSRENGLINSHMAQTFFRQDYRLNLLELFPTDWWVLTLYTLLLITLGLSLIGLWTRWSVIAAGVLLFSFHEANNLILAGGDTVARNIGFILMIAPGIQAVSIDRIRQHWRQWQQNGTFVPALTMPVWPERLLLWQLLIIYVFSVWEKLSGSLWHTGTALAVALRHEHFARWPMSTLDPLLSWSPVLGLWTLAFELSWLGLLIPVRVWANLWRPFLLLNGLAFHLGILILMKVGTFSQIMLAGYPGLLRDSDWQRLERLANRRWHGQISILYDGRCRFCKRSVFTFQLLDWLHRLSFVNYHDKNAVCQLPVDVSGRPLDEAIHIVMPDTTIYYGFDAIRVILRNLPATALLTPLLYLPGITWLGRKHYAYIAARRHS